MEGIVSVLQLRMVLGLVAVAWVLLALLSPIGSLPLGESTIVFDPDFGEKYIVQYDTENPVDPSNLSRLFPTLENWQRHNMTDYLRLSGYLNPKAQRLWIYTKDNSTVHLLIILSSDMGKLHLPSVCYRSIGYKVLSHKVVEINATPSIRIYASELEVKKSTKDYVEQREVLYWICRFGLGPETDSCLVRIECINQTEGNARQTAVDFAGSVLKNVLSGGNTKASQRQILVLSLLRNQNYPVLVGLVLLVLLICIFCFYDSS